MGSKITRVSYIIENGPDRETLFDAFKHLRNKEVNIPIHFTLLENDIEPKYSRCKTRNVQITGIDHDGEEDSTGHSFVIRGKMDVCFYPEASYCDSLRANFETHRFDACYDTQTHRGRLMFQIFQP